jgi:hypothetical protein
VQISLGHYKPRDDDPDPVVAGFGAAELARNDPGVPSDLNAYRTAFSIGHANFQVYGYAGTSRGDYGLERQVTMFTETGEEVAIDDSFRSLWPLDYKPFKWPPTGANLDTSGLRMLEPLP